MKKIREIEEIKAEDAEIVKTDFFEDYAKYLKKHPKKLQSYKNHVMEKYNKTQDTALFLNSLKIVAMAEKKIADLAKTAKVERTSMYRMLSKNANPSFHSIVSFAHNLGMDFRLSITSR
jgi:probable addiction module antidote protein